MELNISDAEMVVMRVIWSLGEAKVEDVERQIAEKQQWSVATIKTLLGRLVKKDILTTVKDGRCFVYHPTLAEDDAIALMGSELVDKVCATKQKVLLRDMILSSALTESDIAQLTEILADKECVDKVECTCLEDFGNANCQHEHEEMEMVN